VTNDVIMPKRTPIDKPPRLTVKNAATASNIYTAQKHTMTVTLEELSSILNATVSCKTVITSFSKKLTAFKSFKRFFGLFMPIDLRKMPFIDSMFCLV